jgi:hypothetical protein
VEDTGRDAEDVRKEVLEALAQLRLAALIEVEGGGQLRRRRTPCGPADAVLQ